MTIELSPEQIQRAGVAVRNHLLACKQPLDLPADSHIERAFMMGVLSIGSLQTESKWLPIDRAPKDGTQILGAEQWRPGDWSYRLIMWVDDFGWDDGDYGSPADRPKPSHWLALTPPSIDD